MEVIYLGHSCFLVQTNRARLLIDPYLNDNPKAAARASTVRCDYVLITHGHEDHVGDALAIARSSKATLIANFEIAEYFSAQSVATHGLNPGGAHTFPFGRVKLTIAHHTSSLNAGLNPIYLGAPCGILIEADERKIYHAGDTALFLDMQLIGRAGLDLALLPIGDNYTMGPDDALDALDFLKPKLCVPMHYNTWPVIEQDPSVFARNAASRGHNVQVLAPGEALSVR